MTIRLEFEEAEIPMLSDGLQSLPYSRVAGLITKLQSQIDSQVKKPEVADEVVAAE
jgi:hypothetical protein